MGSPAEIGASSVADYTVTYTAAGTLNGGKVSLDIPTGWTTAVGLKDADGIDIANDLINTATVIVSTTGALNDADEDGDVVEHLVYAGRTVTATLATLSATQTVSFLIKNVQAPTSVSIDIADTTGTTAGRLTADAIDGTNFVVSSSATVAAPTAIRDVDSNLVSPSVTVRTAAAGTGTAALTTVGTDGRAAAVANQVTNVTTAISANTVTATLGEDDVIDENSRFDFSFLATTAPTTPGVYPFVVSSGGVAVGDPINISVSKSGPGSGALTTTVSPDPVRANASDQTVTFTYTAAETMTSGGVRVTLPTGWTAPKEDADVDIDNLAVDVSGDYDSVTLSAEGQTIVVSSIALTRGQTTMFKWTGAVQNTAGSVSLVSQSKLTSTGSLGDLSTPPTVTVINAAPGTGAISVAGISEVTSGSSGNQLVFDYAPTGTMDGGELILTVPSGWTAPQVTAAGTAGYTTAASTDKILRGSAGTLTVSDQVVTIPITSLASGQKKKR